MSRVDYWELSWTVGLLRAVAPDGDVYEALLRTCRCMPTTRGFRVETLSAEGAVLLFPS